MLRRCLIWALLLLLSSPATAAVQATFYSKEFGNSFPHAFVTVKGVVDGTGEAVDASFGFTAVTVSPAVLMGSVRGEVEPVKEDYIATSDRHFSLNLSDAEYAQLMATVEKWRTLDQPSYNLNHRNCVFFVADLAASIGLKADTRKALMKKPRSYLHALVEDNRNILLQRGAEIDD